MKKPPKKKQPEGLTTEQKINRRNFISFATFFAVGGVFYGGWRWLYNSPVETPGITAGARKPLRKVLNTNESVFRKVFSKNRLVRTYPKSMAAQNVRVNNDIGLTDESFQPENWKLQVLKDGGSKLILTIDEIRALPKTEIVFDFKCIEGWDQIQHWGGVRLVDFMEHYQLRQYSTMKYMGMVTPDEQYYVGMDMESAMHPQTILAYEMNGAPLKPEHGAPLRLIIPVKYGIKNLKRIGSIFFSNTRPRDYWAERGYDYYAGL